MIDILKAFTDDRVMKALTGISLSEFTNLLVKFEVILKEHKKDERGAEHTLKSPKDKLFFILFYLKCYPTFDLAGAIYGVNRAQPFRWFDELRPMLENTLQREVVLPKRKVTKDNFLKIFSDTKEVFLDGTERVINRPKNNDEQKANYSGKKKLHTNKNLVLTNRRREILVLTPTSKGKEHDYGIFKKGEIQIPEEVPCWVDLGFQGILKDYPFLGAIIPKKKPKGLELSEDEKAFNKSVSQVRVISEHANAGIKRMNCVYNKYRNRKDNLSDSFMLLSCGIWNYHLKIS